MWLQLGAGSLHIALAHGQRTGGAAHGQRARGALLPQGQALGGAGIIVGQHGDTGRALGQAGVAVGLLRGLQVPARGLGQLAGLQGELTGHHRFQRQFLSGRGPHGGLGRHRRQGLGAGQGQQQNTGDANQCGHRRHRGLKMSSNGQQLIASN